MRHLRAPGRHRNHRYPGPVALAAVFAVLLATLPAAAQQSWLMAVSQPLMAPSLPASATALTSFAQAVATATGGALVIHAEPPRPAAESRFDAVRSGRVPLAALSLTEASDRSALYAVDLVPQFAAATTAQGMPQPAAAADLRAILARRLAEDGLVLLVWAPVGIDRLLLSRSGSPGAAREQAPAVAGRQAASAVPGHRGALAVIGQPDAALTRLAGLLGLGLHAIDPSAAPSGPPDTLIVLPWTHPAAGTIPPDRHALPLRTHRLAILAHRAALAGLDSTRRAALLAAAARTEHTLASTAPSATRSATRSTDRGAARSTTPGTPLSATGDAPDERAAALTRDLATAARTIFREWQVSAGADAWLLSQRSQP